MPQTTSEMPGYATRREWFGLAVLMLPTILLAVDMTVLHLAAPHLSADLKPTSAQLLWILDIYGFMIAGFLVTMGTLGDRIGRRRLLLAGALAFGIASALAAFSTSAEMLIVTRALLGIAGATLMPSTLSLLRQMFPVAQQRTVAITIWMTGFMIGSAIGPLVGGLMLEFFWWGSAFLLGVPVMLVLLIAGPLLLPESRDEQAGALDVVSALLSVTMVLAAVYGLKDVARNGAGWLPVLALAVALLLGAVFVRRQLRLAEPMFDMDLFRDRAFSTSVVAMMLTILAMSGAWLMIFQYLQGVAGLSPLRAGVVMLPSMLVQVVASLLLPLLARHVSRVRLIAGGLLVAAAGFLVLTQVAGDTAVAMLVAGTVVLGIGVMPMMALGTDLVVSAAPPEKSGAASATSETAIELGMALGIAVIGSVGAAVYRSRMTAQLPAGLTAPDAYAATDTLGGALAVVEGLGGAGPGVLAAARDAFSAALHVNAAIGAVIALATAMLVARFLRATPAAGPVPPPADSPAD